MFVEWESKTKVFVHLLQNGGIRSFVSLHRAATLCDRYQASMLEDSKGGAFGRPPQRAKSLRRNDLLKGKGNFSHEEKFPLNCML